MDSRILSWFGVGRRTGASSGGARFLGSGAIVAAAFLSAPAAHAGIEACGNIDVQAEAQCEMKLEAECRASCEPLRFHAACAGELYVECGGMCEGTLDAECSGTCEGTCEAECANFEAGEFDCSASCQGTCEANCAGSCEGEVEGSEARGRCEASCAATCSGECSASCEGTPPSADCSGKCEASCEGSCTAEARIDCQVSCQSEGFVDCEASLQGGCEAECDAPEGALFCDGQYVDHGGNLEECVNALKALINVEVEGYAYGESSCSGNSCEASGEAGGSVKCSVVPGALGVPLGGSGAVLALLGAAGAAIRRRRR